MLTVGNISETYTTYKYFFFLNSHDDNDISNYL